jgi:hypothetical protein
MRPHVLGYIDDYVFHEKPPPSLLFVPHMLLLIVQRQGEQRNIIWEKESLCIAIKSEA